MEKSARRVSEGVMIGRSVLTRIATDASAGPVGAVTRFGRRAFAFCHSRPSLARGACLAHRPPWLLSPPSIGARHPR